jgi:hypothetical protein
MYLPFPIVITLSIYRKIKNTIFIEIVYLGIFRKIIIHTSPAQFSVH